nr:reverse transcriptase domain-containing protein [Tanacetum cinerariifolium]
MLTISKAVILLLSVSQNLVSIVFTKLQSTLRAIVGPGCLTTVIELSPTSHPGLGAVSSSLFRGGVSALGISAIRLVDGTGRGIVCGGQIHRDKKDGGSGGVGAEATSEIKWHQREPQGVAAAMAEGEASRVRNGYDNNGLGPILAQRTTRSTQVPPVTPAPTATTTTITEAQLQALIDRGVAAAMAEGEASRVRNGYDNNGLGPILAQVVRECTYLDFLKCQPLNFKGTKGVVGLTQWSRSYMVQLPCEDCYPGSCSGIAMENFEENDNRQVLPKRVEKYIGGLPNTIHDSVKAARPKTMEEAIKFATELMDKMIRDVVENKRKFEGTSRNNQNQPHQNKRQNTGRAYAAGNSDMNIYTGSKPLCSKCDYHYEGPCPPRCNNCKRVGHLTRDCRSRPANANNNTNNNNCNNNNNTNDNNHNNNNNTNTNIRNNNNNNQKGNGRKRQCSSKGVCGWKCGGKPRQRHCRYNAVIACAEKLIRIPFGNEILTIYGEGSNERNESRLNIISCSKAQEYMSKGLIQETTEKIVQIKQRMQATRNRQKSYADLKRKPMEFQVGDKVGDKVMLKVSPWKGVVRFGKRGNPQ